MYKWNDFSELAPPINRRVQLKVVAKGIERYADDILIPLTNGTYAWLNDQYADCDVILWRYSPSDHCTQDTASDVLSGVSTSELVNELRYRDGVETHIVEPYKDRTFDVNGAAIVLVVTD